MKRRTYIPTALAAAVLAGLVLPAAAHAATAAPAAVAAPKIQTLWTVNDQSNVHGGVGYITSADKMGIGNNGTGNFAKKNVIVRDENGDEICDSADGAPAASGWECYASPATLSVGTHVLTATAYKKGVASAESKPVTVHVSEGEDAGSGEDVDVPAVPAPGPVDPGFGQEEHAAGPAKPSVTTISLGTTTRIDVQTDPYISYEIFDSRGRWVAGGGVDGAGRVSATVPTPADGASVEYLVEAQDFDGNRSEKTSVVLGATAVAPGTPAPGEVDPGFTVDPIDEGSSALPGVTYDWAYLKTSGGVMTITAAIYGQAGATVVATDSVGVEHSFQANASGRADVTFQVPLGSAPTFSVVQTSGSVSSAPVSITAVRA